MKNILALLLCAAWLPCSAADPLPPASAFFGNVQTGGASISPDGRMVAMLAKAPGTRTGVVLVNLADNSPRLLARFKNADIRSVFWLSTKRLGYTATYSDESPGEERAGLYASDIDGSKLKGLAPAIIARRSFAESEDFPGPDKTPGTLDGLNAQNSDNMIVIVHYDGDEIDAHLRILNTRTGARDDLSAPTGTFNWIVDANKQPRVVLARDGDRHAMFAKGGYAWRKLATFAPMSADAIMPKLYDGTLYVQSRNGGDRVSLYTYDIGAAALAKNALVASPDYDIEGGFISDDKKLLGVSIETDAESTVWFDPEMKALQAEIDEALPSVVNRIERGVRSETPFILVHSYSPRHPGQTLVYNRDTRKFTRLGQALPGIVAEKMAETEMVRYPARDGMKIPAYLTLPLGKPATKLPLIVLVGANPSEGRDHWSWDSSVQFLASRGYAVIQPQVRGTPGFGAAHVNAGIGQWGRGMQDDVADAARWAIKQGTADPERVCVVGTLFGGYAALMGVIRDADLFRCAVSYSGIVDIGMMFKNDWADFPSSGRGLDRKLLIGDPKADKDKFIAVSPLHQAARIQRPVLLAYGAEDVRVPGKHGKMLFDAVKPHNPQAQFHWFDDKGQPPSLEGNRVELWTHIEQFLERHIGSR